MLSVVIPIYNEEGNIAEINKRLKQVCAKLSLAHEFVFVNDGSKDNSLAILKDLAKSEAHVKYISFSRNFGHQIAVMAGLDHCKGDVVVIIDADLQDPPELIEEMYAKYKEGYKVVYAKRNKRKGESWFKLMTAGIFYRILASIVNFEIPLDTGDFRLIDRKVVDALKQMPENNKFLRGQIAWLGFKSTYVMYDRDERLHGKTGYPLRKMLKFALDGITSFSSSPLKFASILGFCVSGLAFSIMLYALFGYFILHDTISGWTSLIISTMFIGGIQLLAIGIIGEYISRINVDVKKRPLYVIDEISEIKI